MADPSETTQLSHETAVLEREELLTAVRALATQVGELQEELHTLRTQARALPAEDGERPGWEERVPTPLRTAPWVRSLDSPKFRRAAIPWLLLEILFLVAVAILAVVADFSAQAAIGVILAAWLLVALAEWTHDRAARRDAAILYDYVAPGAAMFPDDPSWFDPPTERTSLEISDARETTATRLPPPAD
jgi:hypothetical protein